MMRIRRTVLLSLAAAISIAGLACSGGGSMVSPSSTGTTIRGTTVVNGAPGAGGQFAASAPESLRVCVVGTTTCAEVNGAGGFVLSGEFDGDVTLQFTSSQGSVTLTVEDVRRGETIVVSVVLNGTSGTLRIVSREGADDDLSEDSESEDDASEDDESEDDESEDDESEDDESEDDESEERSGKKS